MLSAVVFFVGEEYYGKIGMTGMTGGLRANHNSSFCPPENRPSPARLKFASGLFSLAIALPRFSAGRPQTLRRGTGGRRGVPRTGDREEPVQTT